MSSLPQSITSPSALRLIAQSSSSAQPSPRSAEVDPDPAELLATLKDAASSGKYAVRAIQEAITEAAKIATKADGSALAMRQDGAIVCLARYGETAPPLGAQLDAKSGISGECLRTGQALRCEDTEKDERVDAEICRRLGLRSIAVVPLRQAGTTVGILEVLSSSTNAFDDQAVKFLQQMAELTEAPAPRRLWPGVTVPSRSATEPATSTPAAPKAVVASHTEPVPVPAFLGDPAEEAAPEGRMRALAIAACMLALFFVSFLVWDTWHRMAHKPTAAQTQQQAVPADSTAQAAQPLDVAKPSDAKPTAGIPTDELRNASLVQPAAKLDRDITPEPRSSRSSPSVAKEKPLVVKNGPTTSRQDVSAPPMVTANADMTKLRDMLSAPVSAPVIATRISQGVTPGALIHKVAPAYPQQAMEYRLQGTVVLVATVGEDGRVQNVKVVNGQTLLARAAMDAVKQWRYRPFLLNGKPVKAETQVSIEFKAPR